jgi:two-component system chemotaxis sensor kinase CheA
MVDEICSHGVPSPELKLTLHTLKGNTALMGLGFVAKLCHSIEEHLENTGELSAPLLAQLEERWSIIVGHIADFTGKQSERMVEIPAGEYSLMIAKFSEDADRSELMNHLLSWQMEPVARYFERMAEQARALAVRMGKGNIVVHMDAGSVRVNGDRWAPFFAELVHVVRNAVDHGLESPQERQAAGKPAEGTLILRAKKCDDRLHFELKDDGRGVLWEVIRQKAKGFGLAHASQSDLVNALCHEGLSTKDSATLVSGRGVGMAALRKRVLELNGSLDVRSSAGLGTTVMLSFPLQHRSDVLLDVPAARRTVAAAVPGQQGLS